MTTKSIIKIGKLFSILSLIAIIFFGCQDEIIELTPPNDQETITQNSDLAILMQNTALLDGSFDNILDGANCITINLPVTVFVNGVEVIIDSEEDYEVIEAIFDEFDDDEDDIEIVFPIVIVLNDYTTVEIANQDELIIFIDECLGENEDDEDIECIDFQYPITFSIYDSNFQVTETVIIENDEALYIFIENLEGGVLASLNFPVTMILSDGSTVEVNNNEELQAIIEAAEDDCDEDDDNDWNDDDICLQDDIENYLLECTQTLTLNGYTPSFTNFIFSENGGLFTMFEGDQPSNGNWEIVTDNESVSVTLDFTNSSYSFLVNITGSWEVVECSVNGLVLVQGDNELIMESGCQTDNPFECFEDVAFTACDNDGDGFADFDLQEIYVNCSTNEVNVTFHETLQDAQTATNALISPYTNIQIGTVTIYVRVELINNVNEFEIYEVNLIVEDCTNDSVCTETEVDAILQECEWIITSYAGDTSFNIFTINFMDNQGLVMESSTETYTGNWSTSQNASQVVVAISNISGGNVQILDGNFTVVECSVEQIILHDVTNSNNELVLDRICN